MDARIIRSALVVVALFSLGASYRTPNFVVTAPTQRFAEQVGKTAEEYRRDLAVHWLGKALPNWSQPCPITLQVGENIGAGGATSFLFDRGEVFGWRMEIQGSEERILDSVLPHEVTHTIFASHFRQPLPRWADEGACTTVEHASERLKQQKMLVRFLQTGRGIPFSTMYQMKEYPQDIMPLYSQGYSLARYLIAQGGQRKFMEYVGDGLDSGNWTATTEKHYGYQNLATLQESWLDWVRQGSPDIQPTTIAAANGQPSVNAVATSGVTEEVVVRGQSQGRLAELLGKLSPLRRATPGRGARPKVADMAGDPAPPTVIVPTTPTALPPQNAAPFTPPPAPAAPAATLAANSASRGSVYSRTPATPTSAPLANAAASAPQPSAAPRTAGGALAPNSPTAPAGQPDRQVLLEWSRDTAAPPQTTIRQKPSLAIEGYDRREPIFFDGPLPGRETIRR
ncbi:MAG: hypothetical protein KF708_24515 [Pirellulales bacterium]|nr:hypothetical protein [Pirellulales bacterium]